MFDKIHKKTVRQKQNLLFCRLLYGLSPIRSRTILLNTSIHLTGSSLLTNLIKSYNATSASWAANDPGQRAGSSDKPNKFVCVITERAETFPRLYLVIILQIPSVNLGWDALEPNLHPWDEGDGLKTTNRKLCISENRIWIQWSLK